MTIPRNLVLLRRLWLLRVNSIGAGASASTASTRWLGAASTAVRFKSSVSPAFQHDENDDENNHTVRQSRLRRPASAAHLPLPPRLSKKPPAIQIRSPPLLTDAPETQQQPFAAMDAAARDETSVSPSELKYTGDAKIPITTRLHIVKPGEDTPRGVWPVFRLLDEDGSFRDGSTDGYIHEKGIEEDMATVALHQEGDSALDQLRETLCIDHPHLAEEFMRSRLLHPAKFDYADTRSKDTLARAHRQIVRLREMDTILQNAQRQGRISFYMTCRGEEAIHLGTASALDPSDVILAQYREQGLLMWRGFTLQQFTDQCFSNEADLGKGRQMPVHYGSRALNYQTISSPLGTQIPQASGAAYKLKLSGKKDAISVCFFGEGCTSTTDFHSGLNFAATLNCPVVFVCRNNGYAISTSVKDQYSGDGVVSRAPGYGMAGIRVDGNDIFAVHAAIREARAYALEHSAPVLVEAMSYRQGHHSTSDDSLRYRSLEEIEHFAERCDPLDRLQKFLMRHEYEGMSDEYFRAATDEEKMTVLDAMRKAERKPKPSLDSLFEDVYHEMPESLRAQQEELQAHIAKYPNQY